MRVWTKVLLVVAGLAGVIAWFLFAPNAPQPGQGPPRDPGPPLTDRIVIHGEPQGAYGINTTLGMGAQWVIDGDQLWVCWTLSGTDSRIFVAGSADGGRTFTAPEQVTAGHNWERMLQPALAQDASGTLFLGCIVYDAPPIEDGAPRGITALALLRRIAAAEASWELVAPLDFPPADTTYNSPVVVATPAAPLVFHLTTQGRQVDHLEVWSPTAADSANQRSQVDDDPSGGPKLGFSVVWANDRLQVAYTDGRLRPNRGLYLYTTHSLADWREWAPSQLLDPPNDRFWQAAPDLVALPEGGFVIASTSREQSFYRAAWLDKLRRHGVGGLHQVIAYSREPMLWHSTDGVAWTPEYGLDDAQEEVTASSPRVTLVNGALACAWVENRPLTDAPDIRWALYSSSGWSASVRVNYPANDIDSEHLYALGALADGTLLALYRDSLPGNPLAHHLLLARSVPVGAQSTP